MLLAVALSTLAAMAPGSQTGAQTAGAAADTPSLIDATPASDCAALFGSGLQRDNNGAWRADVFHSVYETDAFVDVVHSVSKWRTPVRMHVPGVEVVEIGRASDGSPRARVRIGEEIGTCDGEYAVGVDDSLGADSQVLAVLDGGVLARHGEQLIMLTPSGVQTGPSFRMIWRSGFVVDVTKKAKKGKKAKKAKSKAKAAKRKPRRATTSGKKKKKG